MIFGRGAKYSPFLFTKKTVLKVNTLNTAQNKTPTLLL